MKPSRAALLLLILVPLFLKPLPASEDAGKSSGLRVKIECEEPSGVLFDRDTLDTSRAVLFSIHAFNQTGQSHIVTFNWKITDAAGKTVLDSREKYTVAGNQFVTRRELFAAKSRGAFWLHAWASSRTDGPDLKGEANFPFAILSSPPQANAPRRSLVLVDAPLSQTDSDLVFYNRMGVRALRSPLAEVGQPRADWGALDSALQARSKQNIGTVGVLQAPPRTALRDDEDWLQFVLLLIQRESAIRTWEIVGNPSPDTLSEIARAARNMNPPRSVLGIAPASFGTSASRYANLDGVIFSPPQNADENEPLHPATLRRAFFNDAKRTRDLGASTFHIREDASTPASISPSRTPQQSADEMVKQAVTALAAGASGTSASLGNEGAHAQFARGAALAFLSNELGDANFAGEAFPESPLVFAEVFGKESGGSVAVLWLAPGQNVKTPDGKLSVIFSGARVLDVFGNAQNLSKNKNLEIPLSASPMFLESASRPEETLRILRDGELKDVAPLAAQVLPLTQPVEKPLDKKASGRSTPVVKTAIRVRLQNVGIKPMSGLLQIGAPPSWKLDGTLYNFDLAPGASKIYSFGVLETKTNDEYPVVIKAIADQKSGKGSWGWTQKAMIATATSVEARDAITLDGNLDDWRDANWMEVSSGGKKGVDAKLALKWDARYLYVAARVTEDTLKPRDESAGEYSFWNGFDAIQLGFGIRDAAWTTPVSGPFRDTDFGFLLSPFHVRADGTTEGRVLRLWNAQQPFGAVSDRVRWGGAIVNARLEIRRDERARETIYEAAIPLNELPELAPQSRLASKDAFDNPVRFSWILHTSQDNARALQWASENNVFAWWNNTNSFLPAQNAFLAAQTLLGFSSRGEVSSGPLSLPPAPTSTPPPAIAPPVAPLPLPPAPANSSNTPLPAPVNPQPSNNPPLPPSSTPAPPANNNGDDDEIGQPLPPYFPPQSTPAPKPRPAPRNQIVPRDLPPAPAS